MWRNKQFRLAVLIAVALLVGVGVLIYADWFGFDEPNVSAAIAPTLVAEVQQRVYRIDPARSVVRYTVEEIFVGQGGNTAVGTTNTIAGDILIDPTHYANSQVGTIVINIEQFTSDSGLRDRRIRREYLESSTYPEAVFVPRDLMDFPATITEGGETAFRMTGDLTIKATTAPVTWDVTAVLNGDTLTGTASTTILMSDYGVGPIDIAGLLETSDDVLLEFDFVALLVPSEAVRVTTAEVTTEP
jgi:polyisoprenoid-binding protein YceI